MEAGADRFRRSDRLLDSRDYRRVSRQGWRVASDSFVLLVAPPFCGASDEGPHAGRRLGITVSRRVGNAVARNLVKRRIREWFRHLGYDCAVDLELVVIARRAATELGSRAFATHLAQLLEKAIPLRRPTHERQGSSRG